jgi:hypothetical protein
MAGKGGKRPGAGRKPKAVKRVMHQTPIQAAEGKIVDRLPWLVDKMFELAEGVHVEKPIADGVTIVYQQIPDRQAIAYLIDRVLGKPTQPIDVRRSVLELAAQEGLTEEEAALAVAEGEQMLKAKSGTRS